MVYPIVLGTGKRLFAEADGASAMRLVDATTAGETVILTFHPARPTGAAIVDE